MTERIDPQIIMPCGSTAYFDGDYSYRCTNCMAVIGSMGMPIQCKEAVEKYENWGALGGKGWNYKTGEVYGT